MTGDKIVLEVTATELTRLGTLARWALARCEPGSTVDQAALTAMWLHDEAIERIRNGAAS